MLSTRVFLRTTPETFRSSINPIRGKGYAATAKEVAQLIKLASYYVYAAGTISVDGKPVCSVVNDGTITAGIGNVIRVPKGTTINYTLKSNGIQTASVSVFNCI